MSSPAPVRIPGVPGFIGVYTIDDNMQLHHPTSPLLFGMMVPFVISPGLPRLGARREAAV